MGSISLVSWPVIPTAGARFPSTSVRSSSAVSVGVSTTPTRSETGTVRCSASCTGTSLHGPLEEETAERYTQHIVEGVAYLHSRGVVHRDIKPANILIDLSGGARLADMGLAFSLDDPAITVQGATLGTPHYISPEQAVDPASADIQSDIWSFGATLFHALVGRVGVVAHAGAP